MLFSRMLLSRTTHRSTTISWMLVPEEWRTYMPVQDQLLRAIDTAAERIIEASRQIHEHPEVRFQEHSPLKR
jgi:hypothetical protein